MKIIPNITVQGFDKSGQPITYPPFIEVNLAKDIAEDLINRGFAVLSKDAGELETPASGPSVTQLPDTAVTETATGAETETTETDAAAQPQPLLPEDGENQTMQIATDQGADASAAATGD